MSVHEAINYVEYPASDLDATKAFFTQAFAWTFTDYGPDYTAFAEPVLNGGFFRSQQSSKTENGAALVVFYSNDIVQTQTKIEAAGGKVTQALFDFPGGCRFQFEEPSGNEFAVWSEST